MDVAKYRNLFLEEAGDHLSEMGRALLELEKDPARSEALDLVFRMAHSIKGMAGSLGYAAVTELAHGLEDRMDAYRSAGRVEAGGGIALLFRGLDALERMVACVRESGEPPAEADAALLADLRGDSPARAEPAPPKKKAARRP